MTHLLWAPIADVTTEDYWFKHSLGVISFFRLGIENPGSYFISHEVSLKLHQLSACLSLWHLGGFLEVGTKQMGGQRKKERWHLVSQES